MLRVRILLGTGRALPDFLTRLRQFLDHARLEPRRFHTRGFSDGAVAVELDFASAADARRFKAEYGAETPAQPLSRTGVRPEGVEARDERGKSGSA
jgi:hypothetical protein